MNLVVPRVLLKDCFKGGRELNDRTEEEAEEAEAAEEEGEEREKAEVKEEMEGEGVEVEEEGRRCESS
jgi:hypothetical protein